MNDDDDTPPAAPFCMDNIPLLTLLADLCSLAEAHSRELLILCSELRRLRDPVGPGYVGRLAQTLSEYHRHGARLAGQVSGSVGNGADRGRKG